jgi:hypothetical protein
LYLAYRDLYAPINENSSIFDTKKIQNIDLHLTDSTEDSAAYLTAEILVQMQESKAWHLSKQATLQQEKWRTISPEGILIRCLMLSDFEYSFSGSLRQVAPVFVTNWSTCQYLSRKAFLSNTLRANLAWVPCFTVPKTLLWVVIAASAESDTPAAELTKSMSLERAQGPCALQQRARCQTSQQLGRTGLQQLQRRRSSCLRASATAAPAPESASVASASYTPRKVALFVEPSPFSHISGMKNRFECLIKTLREAGDEVMVVTPDVNPPKEFCGAQVCALQPIDAPTSTLVA